MVRKYDLVKVVTKEINVSSGKIIRYSIPVGKIVEESVSFSISISPKILGVQ